MRHMIISVKPLLDFELLAEFEDKTVKYDVKPLFSKFEAFNAFLLTKGLFEQVKICGRGIAVEWNDDLDLYCEEIYEYGVEQETV